MVKKKNRTFKFANNHKTNYHKLTLKNHIVSKGLRCVYKELAPVYQEVLSDFDAIDLVDLEFYERWLNG